MTSCLEAAYRIASYHITSHDITSHHITSHHLTTSVIHICCRTGSITILTGCSNTRAGTYVDVDVMLVTFVTLLYVDVVMLYVAGISVMLMSGMSVTVVIIPSRVITRSCAFPVSATYRRVVLISHTRCAGDANIDTLTPPSAYPACAVTSTTPPDHSCEMAVVGSHTGVMPDHVGVMYAVRVSYTHVRVIAPETCPIPALHVYVAMLLMMFARVYVMLAVLLCADAYVHVGTHAPVLHVV